MLMSLMIPVVLATVGVFFASFLSWMVLQLHRHDWKKIANEDEFLQAVRKCEVPPGNYMFPGCSSPEEQKSDEHQKKWAAGPCGVVTFYGPVNMGANMGRNLGMTFLYFLVVNFCLAYLATLGVPRGADFMTVFRFVSTAGLMTFFAAIVPHAIWFGCRIVGHIVESIAFAAISGAIFAAMWPKA